jgi:hypothetical protein
MDESVFLGGYYQLSEAGNKQIVIQWGVPRLAVLELTGYSKSLIALMALQAQSNFGT